MSGKFYCKNNLFMYLFESCFSAHLNCQGLFIMNLLPVNSTLTELKSAFKETGDMKETPDLKQPTTNICMAKAMSEYQFSSRNSRKQCFRTISCNWSKESLNYFFTDLLEISNVKKCTHAIYMVAMELFNALQKLTSFTYGPHIYCTEKVAVNPDFRKCYLFSSVF